jgi:hypothetical protein
MTLRREDKCLSKFRVTVEGANALHNILEIDIEQFLANDDLLADKFQARRQSLVNAFIELPCCAV